MPPQDMNLSGCESGSDTYYCAAGVASLSVLVMNASKPLYFPSISSLPGTWRISFGRLWEGVEIIVSGDLGAYLVSGIWPLCPPPFWVRQWAYLSTSRYFNPRPTGGLATFCPPCFSAISPKVTNGSSLNFQYSPNHQLGTS